MTRWIVGAVLAAAGAFLVYPLEAAAQAKPNVALACNYTPEGSFVVIESLLPKKRAKCMWRCVYRMSSGALHVNQGARTLPPRKPFGKNKTKKVAPGITGQATAIASCR
jgi:hypothetical protein